MEMIYKHGVDVGAFNLFSLDLPYGAKILHIGNQREQPFFWVQQEVDSPVDTSAPRHFLCIATGRPMPEPVPDYHYLGTIHFFESREIYHYFEV